ncbi:MAG: hypothetical protein WC736_15515 [Gallionella sp.]|jgi:hypothetical protein
MKLSETQQKLLARIKRAKVYALNPKEDISAQILFRAGLIRLVGITAYPVEGR